MPNPSELKLKNEGFWLLNQIKSLKNLVWGIQADNQKGGKRPLQPPEAAAKLNRQLSSMLPLAVIVNPEI